MNFEWDEQKNQANIRSHDLDFFDAWEIFEGPVLDLPDSRYDYGEDRIVGIGILRDLIVAVVFVEKYGDTIRIISLRRALKHERNRFLKYIQDQLGTSGGDDR